MSKRLPTPGEISQARTLIKAWKAKRDFYKAVTEISKHFDLAGYPIFKEAVATRSETLESDYRKLEDHMLTLLATKIKNNPR